jgi:hypothetical protein
MRRRLVADGAVSTLEDAEARELYHTLSEKLPANRDLDRPRRRSVNCTSEHRK